MSGFGRSPLSPASTPDRRTGQTVAGLTVAAARGRLGSAMADLAVAVDPYLGHFGLGLAARLTGRGPSHAARSEEPSPEAHRDPPLPPGIQPARVMPRYPAALGAFTCLARPRPVAAAESASSPDTAMVTTPPSGSDPHSRWQLRQGPMSFLVLLCVISI